MVKMASPLQASKEMTEEVCISPNSFRFTVVQQTPQNHPSFLHYQQEKVVTLSENSCSESKDASATTTMPELRLQLFGPVKIIKNCNLINHLKSTETHKQ